MSINLKPMPPNQGPPLPEFLDAYLPWKGYWPWYKPAVPTSVPPSTVVTVPAGSTAAVTGGTNNDTTVTDTSGSTTQVPPGTTLTVPEGSTVSTGSGSAVIATPTPAPTQASPITYSNPQASNSLYAEGITAWACVAYQVTITNNTNQDVTIGYNIHAKEYNTATPNIIKYDVIVPNYADTRYPVFRVTIPANSSSTQNFNISPYQLELSLGDTMELSLVDFASGYTANEIDLNGLGFSGDSVEAKGTETPVAKTSF